MGQSFVRGALLVLLAIGLGACGNPCEALADLTCEKAGVSAPACQAARKQAQTADRAEREACRRAREIYEAATRP